MSTLWTMGGVQLTSCGQEGDGKVVGGVFPNQQLLRILPNLIPRLEGKEELVDLLPRKRQRYKHKIISGHCFEKCLVEGLVFSASNSYQNTIRPLCLCHRGKQPCIIPTQGKLSQFSSVPSSSGAQVGLDGAEVGEKELCSVTVSA